MVLESTLYGYRIVALIAGVFAAGSAAVGLYIGYLALRSYYRHEDPSMRYLSIGLILITSVTYSLSFAGSVLIQLRLISLPKQDVLWILTHFIQFTGLICIMYALYRRD
jgi:hypothetical protein